MILSTVIREEHMSEHTFGCFFFVQAEVVLGLHLITCIVIVTAESQSELESNTAICRLQVGTLYAVMTLASLEANRPSIVATRSLSPLAILFT